ARPAGEDAGVPERRRRGGWPGGVSPPLARVLQREADPRRRHFDVAAEFDPVRGEQPLAVRALRLRRWRLSGANLQDAFGRLELRAESDQAVPRGDEIRNRDVHRDETLPRRVELRADGVTR